MMMTQQRKENKLKHIAKISFEFPIVGVEEFEADTEADAIALATDKYGKDKKNFNVEIISEEAAKEVLGSGDVRSSDGGNDTSGSNVGEAGTEGSNGDTVSST